MSSAATLADRRPWRSVAAVAAGVATIIVATTLVDILLHVVQVFPPLDVPLDDRLSLVASSYRLVISVGGAYLTAHLAPRAPLGHALILGLVGTVLGAAGVAATWGKAMGPQWYPISLAVLAVPQCWAGGWLYQRRHPEAEPK